MTAAALENKEKTKKENCEAEKKKKKTEKSFPQTMDKTGVQKTLYYLSVQQVSNSWRGNVLGLSTVAVKLLQTHILFLKTQS